MNLLSVDEKKCRRDGICKEVCPAEIIDFKLDDGFPAMIDGGDVLCIRCGHCVAACPHMALNHESIQAEDCPPVSRELLPTAEQAEHFLRSRRSMRLYKKKPVERALLSDLIHTARFAPSGHNLQPVEWLVIQDPEEVNRLAGVVIDWMRRLIQEKSPLVETMHLDKVVQSWEKGTERILRGAPHLIIAHAHRENPAGQTACIIALTYMELMAPALGLGSCWAGYFTRAAALWPPMKKALDLPEDQMVFGALMVGYPRYQYCRLPPRNPPRIRWR